jgi:hypothetical protein
MATTIKLLEVRLEVQGDSYEREFTRLFNQHMQRYQQLAAEQRHREQADEFDRQLGDQERMA